MLGRIRVGAGGEPDVVGVIGATGIDLGAVDDPFVAVLDRRGLERGQIGAGIRLGVANGKMALATLQVFTLYVVP